MVGISTSGTKVYKIFKLCKAIYIFRILQHFATKLCNFTSLRSRRLVRAGKEETPAQMAMTNLFLFFKDD